MTQYSGVYTLQTQGQALTSGQWATDPYYKNTTLLLHADGVGGGSQNNTFVDSSIYGFAITRNGNTTQGSFTPYGPDWSNYFDGTQTLAFPSNTAFAFGTGAYTVEMWVFVTGIGSNGYSHFFNAGNATGSFGFAAGSDYSLNVFGYGTGAVITGSANDITKNAWNHIAVCRSSTASNDTKIYVNGVLKTTGTDATNWTVTTTPAVGGITNLSGYSTLGYISNCRVVKGSAVYTTAFNPTTSPLTNITNTSLLTCQSNRFIDNSSNAFAITVNGTPSVQRFSPFPPQYQYTPAVIGGSGYFDGTGDYLSVAGNSAFAFGTGDFTIECWIFVSSNPAQYTCIMSNWAGSDPSWLLDFSNASGNIRFNDTNNVYLTSSSALQTGQWNHVAVSRSGTSLQMFFNGTSVASATNSTSFGSASSGVYIGEYYNTTYPLTGYLSDVRVNKGTAIYTGAFTPPTLAPLATSGASSAACYPSTTNVNTSFAASTTSLLCSMTNAGIYDNAMMNNLETVGDAQVSTKVAKYGSGSLAFDGTGDGLLCKQFNQSFGGDFTFEFWIYRTGTSVEYPIDTYIVASGNQPVAMYINSGGAGAYNAVFNGGTRFTGPAGSLPANTWTHVAMVRANGVHSVYINGIANPSTYITTTAYNNCQLAIGRDVGNFYSFTGYLDDVRITNGVARYTGNFIPPKVAMPNQ